LLRANRGAKAKLRAKAFHAKYPQSALWPKIERELGAQ